MRQIKNFVRAGLVTMGSRLPPGMIGKAANFVKEIELKSWMMRHGLVSEKTVTRREELFELVASEVGEARVCYLEFGVAAGKSMRIWSGLLKHPAAVLHGFDSFEGLPETWVAERPKGMFSTGGSIPQIDDPRVKFFKGLFESTLPDYEPPEADTFIINIDADLYSSTSLVLRRLGHLIRPGTYLYFDEFVSYGHEERAFREFVEETGAKFRLRGATNDLLHVLFQCVEA